MGDISLKRIKFGYGEVYNEMITNRQTESDTRNEIARRTKMNRI